MLGGQGTEHIRNILRLAFRRVSRSVHIQVYKLTSTVLSDLKFFARRTNIRNPDEVVLSVWLFVTCNGGIFPGPIFIKIRKSY